MLVLPLSSSPSIFRATSVNIISHIFPIICLNTDVSSSSRQLCLLESPDLRLVKQRVRQPKLTILLLPLLTSRPFPPLLRPHASEKGSPPRRAPTTHYLTLGLQVDGPRDKRSPKPFHLRTPTITTTPHPDLGERESPLLIWTARSKSLTQSAPS